MRISQQHGTGLIVIGALVIGIIAADHEKVIRPLVTSGTAAAAADFDRVLTQRGYRGNAQAWDPDLADGPGIVPHHRGRPQARPEVGPVPAQDLQGISPHNRSRG